MRVLAALLLAATMSSPRAPSAPVIGYVGCSNTSQSVAGAWANGFTQFWPGMRYGGGTIQTWAAGQKWSDFDTALRRYPTTTFWFQLCEVYRDHISGADSLAKAITVINDIRARAPAATIYVSAVNDYVAPHVSPKLGPDGPQNMRDAAASLVAAGYALAGPDMGSLLSIYQVPSAGATRENNETEIDGTHPNVTLGQPHLGRRLAEFFGALP